MSINVEGYGVQPPSPGRQQLQTESRQDRWMYEFEHALLQEAGKKPRTAPDRPRPQDGGADARTGWTAQQAVDNPLAGSAPTRPGLMIDSAVPAHHANVSAMAAAAPGVSKIAESSFSTDAASSADSGAASVGESATHPNLFTGQEASSGRQSESTVTPMAGLQVEVSAANKALATSSLMFGASTGSALTRFPSSGASEGSVALMPATASRAATGLGWNAEAVAHAGAAPEQAEEAEEAAAQPRTPVPQAKPETQDYAARLLHVYSSADGVQAWIRDAAIDQTQARAVAQAMAGELAAGGALLTALTVNGRPQTLSAAAAASDKGDEFLDDERGADALAHLFKPYDMTKNGAA